MRFTLETEPSLVILTARWELWLEDSRVDLLAMDGTPIPADQKRELLAETVETIVEAGAKVVVMGQVPSYQDSVPYRLAVNDVAAVQGSRQYKGIQSQAGTRWLTGYSGFVDVAPWLCRPECAVNDSAGAYYRDSNHLSEHGAVALAPNLVAMLQKPLVRSEM